MSLENHRNHLSSDINIECIDSVSKLSALEKDWRRLEKSLPPLPFFTFDWMSTWWTFFHAESYSVRDALYALAFRAHDGTLLGVAPMMRTIRPGIGSIGIRQLQYFGADPNVTEMRSLIASPTDAVRIYPVLLEYLRSRSREWDFFTLSGVPLEYTATLNLDRSSLGRVTWVQDVPNYYLVLAPTWEEFKSGLSRNIKESIRKCYNAPKRDGILFTTEVIRKTEDVPDAVSAFLRLHEARSEMSNTVQHGNVFAAKTSRDFLVKICNLFAERDCLRIFQTKLDGKVVATRICFCCQDSLYLYFSGYDPTYSKYSVMTRTVAEAVQYAIIEGFKTVNLSMGNDVSKTRWRPQEAIYKEYLVLSPTNRALVTYRTYTWVRQKIENSLRQTRIAKFLSRRV